ncbi:MAG TPA: class I SAM-dependent methyltransferase [Pseudolabrys sp.]|nr:class I SAM-dependent methyltransferase [Pseudolabrys sp.]
MANLGFQPISVEELPKWRGEIVNKILGLTQPKLVTRTIEKVQSEYDQDKWSRARAIYRSDPHHSARSLLETLIDADPDRQRACVVNGQLGTWTCRALYTHLIDAMERWFGPSIAASNSVVELGAAFGAYPLLLSERFPDKSFYGADLSPNAISLAREVSGQRKNVAFEEFNFLSEHYPILDRAAGPVTVFTAQALEQLPSAERPIATLLSVKSKIHRVFHLEPVFELHDNDLLGLMRKRYAEISDYNRDLLGVLRRHESAGRLKVMRVEKNTFAFNPFNCLSLIEWAPL